jgi:1-acyl-sn-glycerol-3-phosphate acyltransferase
MPDLARRERVLDVLGALADAGMARPGDDVTLADAGIDSLAFAELAIALEGELGVDLGAARLDASSTVADLVRAVESADASAVPTGLPPGIGGLQGVADALGGPALRWWFGLRVEGATHVPVEGPAVLAMNHESALDIPITVVACPRRITFMAKKELYKNAAVGWALRRLGGFRVDRDRFDLPAVRTALAAIDRGEVLGMYPEGTRSPGTLLPFLPGAAWVALARGVPLVPCSISGTDRAHEGTRPRRVAVRVVFHAPLAAERVEDPADRRRRAAELTHELRAAVILGLAGPR